jgi:hypothetical protein
MAFAHMAHPLLNRQRLIRGLPDEVVGAVARRAQVVDIFAWMKQTSV